LKELIIFKAYTGEQKHAVPSSTLYVLSVDDNNIIHADKP